MGAIIARHSGDAEEDENAFIFQNDFLIWEGSSPAGDLRCIIQCDVSSRGIVFRLCDLIH